MRSETEGYISKLNATVRRSIFVLSVLSYIPIAVGQSTVPPAQALVVGIRETAKHRPDPPPVRCVGGKFTDYVLTRLDVDAQGRVVGVQGLDGNSKCAREIEAAARTIRYFPFIRNGRPVEVQTQEEFTLLPPEEKPVGPVPFPNFTDPRTVSIQLSRSTCFGPCPAYLVTIRGDGNISYQGDSFVTISGRHASRIGAPQVAALLNRFRAANFFALKDEYQVPVTDGATYRLTITIGEHVKTVIDYGGEAVGMPSAVVALEEAVDATADTARWVTSSPATVQAMREAGIALKSPEAGRILSAAILAGDYATAGALLSGGTPLASDALELAVESRGNKLRTLQTLLASDRVRRNTDALQRGLGAAAESGDVELAGALIKAGADPSVRFTGVHQSEQGMTYLMLAASSGVWAMLEDALGRPHDIHAVDAEGRTAIFYVFWTAPGTVGIFPLIDRLLAAGADRAELNQILPETCSPDWIAGLVARGAEISARGANGDTSTSHPCSRN